MDFGEILKGVDVNMAFKAVEDKITFDYRDPLLPPYGDPKKMTTTQEKGWAFLKEWTGLGPQIAMIAAKGAAKALQNNEPVLTPSGWVPIGDIKVNDFVIGQDGIPAKVLAVQPQGIKSIYRVHFSDGEYVDATLDHRWAVQTGSQKSRKSGFVVKTTAEIYADLKTKQGYNKWYLPNTDPVHFEEKDQPILPAYSLGALLGDGHLGESFRFSTEDDEILDRIVAETGATPSRYSGCDYGLIYPNEPNKNPLKDKIRKLGLMGSRSYDKHVPKEYLFGRLQDRIDLLRGLMDTDGSVNKGTGYFTTVSIQLAKDVLFLVRSLGGVTSYKEYKTSSDFGRCYKIRISLPINPFYLKRKADLFNVDATQGRARSISKIEYLSEDHATCIAVDNKSHLFLTRAFIPTHNTHFGACFAFHQAQTFPESMGCLVSNTYGQAKDNGLPIFRKVAKQLGYKTEFFSSKKIRGQPLTSVCVVYLAEDVYSYLLIRSYEEIQNFEGVEIDWLWSEEGQDTDYQSFRVPYTRNRGQYGDNAFFYAAMPEDGSHWQYHKLPALGMPEEAKFVPLDKDEVIYSRTTEAEAQDIDPMEVGILYEFSVFENKHNVGRQYIQRNSMAYTGAMYDRYVLGKRGSSRTNKMVPAFNPEVHQTGFMPVFLKGFDEHRDSWLILDFNVAPCCAGIFQKKPWNDLWAYHCYFDDEEVLRASAGCPNHEPDDEIKDINLVAPPDRDVYVQTGEIEAWNGGTRGMMQIFADKYQGYQGNIIVNGDASGNSEKSSATTTDWAIVAEYLTNHGFNYELQRGLVVTYPEPNDLDGKTRYSNPPRKDTFNLLNGLFVDNSGRIHLVLMPASEYESGGIAASVGAMVTKPDGTWDERCDDKEGRDVPRTHFTDDLRYFAFLVTGGSLVNITGEDHEATGLMVQRQLNRAKSRVGTGEIRREMMNQAPGIRSSASRRRGSKFAI